MLQTVRVRGRQPEDEDCRSIISEATAALTIIYPVEIAFYLHRFISKYHHNMCAISSISSSTSIQLFSEEGIIHRLGERFYQHKIL